MAQTPDIWRARGAAISLALLGSVALASAAPPATHGVAPGAAAQTDHAEPAADRSWLCGQWAGPGGVARRCTRDWFLDASGHVVAADPAWVPVAGVADAGDAQVLWVGLKARPAVTKPQPTALHLPDLQLTAARRLPPPPPVYSANGPTTTDAPAGGGYWFWTPPPGYPAYAMADYAGDPNAAFYGYCTWYAQQRRPDEPLMRLGNAWSWAYTASSFGLSTGQVPAVGATVVFQPGVFGAGGLGHVAHVEALLGGGWFLISEMNMDWNGGGFGRVSYRYMSVVPGITFIY